MRSGREAGQDLDVAWRGVYGTADEIKYRFGYVKPIDQPVPSRVTHRYGRDTHRHAQNQKPNALLPLMQMAMTSLTSLPTIRPRYAVPEQKLEVRSLPGPALLGHIRPQPPSQRSSTWR